METVAIIVLGAANFILLLLMFLKKRGAVGGDVYSTVEKQNEKLKKEILETTTSLNNLLISTLRSGTDNINQSLKVNTEQLNAIMRLTDSQLARMTKTVDEKLSQINEQNSKNLAEIKQTVDNELNKNLTSKLNESFNIISERLESLYTGLGEIKNLSTGVSDLRRVLSGVKTRGMLGEVQLSSLLEQMLAPSQFATNVEIKKGSAERVEFAIKLPGKDEQNIFLPIDAKFPIEDYARLCDFSDKGMKAEADMAAKQLEHKIRLEAKKISEKYICPPFTTDFAIMYIPTEGLFAEIMRNTALVEDLQQKLKIIVCSPTTIAALLSSLQLGFKTLFIEKRSSEIWQLLSAFRHEFLNFSSLIEKTQKQISAAGETLENADKKSKRIQKQLSKVAENAPEYLTFETEND